ncbi:copper chaperone PCu(A)C [Thiohalorhabdus sp.]|uniref:copper chaperone PCu(A)C n=1 Tax=Thiohalorhabdus sp. TaxID=3094134 RepID=UPI002FC2A287
MTKLLLLAILLTAGPALADSVAVSDAWVRLVPGDGPSAAYLTLKNRGDDPVELVGAKSPRYGRITLHESVESGGTSRMAHVEGITVTPGDSRELAPGGFHLMLMDPQEPPEVGDSMTLSLLFADGASVDAAFTVEPPYSQGPE